MALTTAIVLATVTTLRIESPGFVESLRQEDLDIAGIDHVNGTVDVLSRDEGEERQLRARGFHALKMRAIDPRAAPDAAYRTPDGVAASLASLHERFPDLTLIESIGQSLEGRDIWALKVSKTPATHDPAKPTVLFNGLHHAREVMTPEVVLDTAEHLLSLYGQDSQVTHWVDANEIWLVPMLNVDGNNKVWHGNSLWRKNTRGLLGVDINRNYPFHWGSCDGSSGLFFAENYRGSGPGSEPETQVLMNLVAKIQPVFDISYHSYSELVIYPYGCDGARADAKDSLESIGREMAARLPRDDGKGNYEPGTSWEVLYATDGTDIDWMYHEQNVLAYTIEMNGSDQGFQPDFADWRQKTVEKLRAGWGYLLDRLDGSGVRGVVTLRGRAAPSASVAVQNLGAESGAAFGAPVRADGSFHLLLEPGAYKLTVEAGGYSAEREVVVGAQRIDLVVDL